MSLFAAIMAALYRRERTGRGGMVSTSLMANGLWWNAIQVQAALCGAKVEPRPPREDAASALANLYRCADGRWFLLNVLQEDRDWDALTRAIARPDVRDDPRFATTPARLANAKALISVVDAAFAQRRKTLRAALAGWAGSAAAAETALVAAGVSPQARGESLTVEEFAAIAEHKPAREPGPVTADGTGHTGGERRGDLVRNEVEREVEGADRADDADRVADGEGELALAGLRGVHRDHLARELAGLDGGHGVGGHRPQRRRDDVHVLERPGCDGG
jgi:hypothetical protein